MPRHRLVRFRYTVVVAAIAVLISVAAIVWHINVFAFPGVGLIGIEESEAGEVAIAFLLIVPAFFIDRVVARERAHDVSFQAEQLRVVRVTMRTVQDIVNNNLNQLQLLRLEADGCVPIDTLALFDTTIQDTAAQLTALGNMKAFAEKPMASGSGLDLERSCSNAASDRPTS
jgi:hypothetical protein